MDLELDGLNLIHITTNFELYEQWNYKNAGRN